MGKLDNSEIEINQKLN